jgi:hypothetical protein
MDNSKQCFMCNKKLPPESTKTINRYRGYDTRDYYEVSFLQHNNKNVCVCSTCDSSVHRK